MFCYFLQGCVTRRTITNDTLIIMDNASIQYKRHVKETFDINEIPLKYLPVYSPGFNAIENVFSILKSKVSSRRPVANDRETLKTYIINAIYKFNQSPQQTFLNLYKKCEMN
ncbi:hypothetical protein DMUE_1738 [Dictyocoela muelleri]|nr:hypothetical protein DMUE_1738 [Dictyocoela muelleri]